MNSAATILVAGIGNIFLGDDAFGVEVLRKLIARGEQPGVRMIDFGIRGLDLVYALLDGYEVVIFVDAVPRGEGPPGTLYLLRPQLDALADGLALIEAHAMDPVKVLRTAIAMGASFREIFIVGCEPTPLENPDDGDVPLALSAPVARAVDQAVSMVEELVQKAKAGAGRDAVQRQEQEISP